MFVLRGRKRGGEAAGFRSLKFGSAVLPWLNYIAILVLLK